MVTLEEARDKVASLLQEWNEGKSGPHKLVILDEQTMERSWGWVFFYTSRGWRDGDLSYAIGGNAPFIVNRHTDAVVGTGTARTVEFYVQNYELTGDPYARPGSRVVFESANPGADIIAAVRLLREFSEWSIGDIKAALDAVIEGKSIVVQAESISAAETLCSKLGSIGFICHQQPESAT
jgi:hypothetical protein